METLNDSTIKNFAAAVRAELKDLPKSTIDELAGDLEESLAERKFDEGEGFELGSPAVFAAELREAAGVNPKPGKSKIFSTKAFNDSLESWFRKSGFSEAILEFGTSIRPLWWIARATMAWGLFCGYNLSNVTNIALLAILCFLSVQWGRKKWFTTKFFAAILLPLNLLAVLLVPVSTLMVSQKISNIYNTEYMLQNWPAIDGLRMNGEIVSEIHAYNLDNQEVTGLRYEDQNGVKLEAPVTEQTQYTVPDIIGMNMFDAQRALADAGIPSVDFVYLNNVNEQEAFVVKVEPSLPGALVTSRDTVTVTLDRR